MHSILKAAHIRRLAFSLTILSVFIACEDPGSAGNSFVSQSEVVVDTVLITSLPLDTENPYLGKLTFSPIGEYSDPLFGDIQSVALFKPTVVRASTADSVIDNTSIIKLRLRLSEDEVYGDTTSTASYSVFRVNELWKGSSYTKNSSFTYGNELIGQFNDSVLDTLGNVEFELTGSWKDDYINFYNLADSIRGDEYRLGDFGLAIIPDVGNSKINYANFSLSSMVIMNDDTSSVIILDWTADLTRSGETADAERIKVHSTYENYVAFALDSVIANVNTNFVRAELVLVEDTLAMQTSLIADHVRTTAPGFRLLQGPVEDKAYEFGFTTTGTNGFFIDGEYRFNISSVLNNHIYGNSDISEMYIFPFTTNGILGFSSIYAPGSDPALAPKIIIYGLRD